MGNKKKSKRQMRKNLCKDNSISKQNASICVLDDDSLRHVFTFLPAIDRIRIQRVCKRWQRITKLPWSDLKSLNCNFDIDFDRKMLIKLPTIKFVLEVSGNYLTELVLPCYHVASGTVLMKLVKKTCPKLRSITLLGVTITRTTAQFLADNFNDLTELCLGNCWPDCEPLISQFLAKNPKLRSIKFRSSWGMRGSCMTSLSAESLNELIINNGDHFSPKEVHEALKNFSNLRLFSVFESDKLLVYIEPYLQALPNKSSLEKLVLKCGSYSNENLEMNNIGLFDNLRELLLFGNLILHDQVLVTIAAHCKNLAIATLYESNRVTDLAMGRFVELPKLEKLTIFNLDKVTDYSFDEKDIRSLKILRCYDCFNITNGTFEYVLGECKNLQRLEVVGCTIGEACLIGHAKRASAERDPDIDDPLELYLQAPDDVEEVVKVSPTLRIFRKKEEFFFGPQKCRN